MPRQITKDIYKFEELSEVAKETARDWYRNGSLDYDWWDSCYDDFGSICKILGVELATSQVKLMNGSFRSDPRIWFSGFWSQGDGACYEGRYRYQKDSVKKIKEYAPQDKVLHEIATDLFIAQRRAFYGLYATIEHRDRYCHSGCMSIDVEHQDGIKCDEDSIIQPLRELADWLYCSLEREYDYLMSDEAVDDSIIANEYEFDEYGSLA